jgi:hypothetical protein
MSTGLKYLASFDVAKLKLILSQLFILKNDTLENQH